LIAEVHKPAEAKRYAEQQDADSKKYARVADSEAQLTDERNRAESRKVTADAEAHAIEARGRAEAEVELQRRSKDAEAVRLEGQAEADSLRAKGEAEAAAIRAKGDAEAETTRARAEAYKQFNDAAVLAQVLEVLPEVAGELASPYSNISNLSVFSTDGEAKIGQNISVGLAQVLDMVKSTTGVDFQDTLQRAAEGGRAVREQSEQTRGAGLSAAAESSTEDVEGEEA